MLDEGRRDESLETLVGLVLALVQGGALWGAGGIPSASRPWPSPVASGSSS